MVVELINTGNELMLGRVLNSNQQWLCRQLSDRGYGVSRQLAIGDSAPGIEHAVRDALSRADLLIITGGLGPTWDDLTRDTIAEMLGKPLREDPAALAQVERFFASRNRPMPPSTRVEALVPEDAIVLPNLNGTAPGLAIEVPPGTFRPGPAASWLIMLPGPPRELQPMFLNSVLPLLERVLPAPDVFVCRTLRTVGIGESIVQERIRLPLQGLVAVGLEVGYCARPGQVDVRLVARGAGAEQRVAEGEALVRAEVGINCFGLEEDTLEAAVVAMLTTRKETLALAESCTGGLIAHRLTNIPGASAVLSGGFVTYSNAMKQTSLGVDPATLEQYGAVSEQVARQMAEGARGRSESTYALAVTGIAGPGGGTAEKPVGTVFIALASRQETQVWKQFNPWDRTTFKEVTASQALNYLRLRLESETCRGDTGQSP